KDQFKTDKAKFIAPAPIELKLSVNTNIDQVCVVGTGLPQPIALVTLSAVGRDKDQKLVEGEIQQAVEQTNKTLEKYEHIQVVVVLQDNWSIENGLMTPSLKIKRNAVEKRYEARYIEWVSRKEVIVWEKRELESSRVAV
ncbi:MAG TPA: AMP-dependent synthetase, partial [Chryseosolibacter sp.]|nr:AMP-dependent synthetase [Chryseosolibacter sp.]